MEKTSSLRDSILPTLTFSSVGETLLRVRSVPASRLSEKELASNSGTSRIPPARRIASSNVGGF